MSDRRELAHRQANAPDIDRVREWVSRWWGQDLSDLAITEFSIACPGPTDLGIGDENAVYLEAFRKKNESDLHKLLKYAAWLWLEQQVSLGTAVESKLVQFEQKLYFPTDIAEEVWINYSDDWPLEERFDITRAQVVPRGDRYADFSFGISFTIDIFGKGRNIEVGGTQPANLCMPFDNGLSVAAIWVPFPNGLQPKDFSLSDYSFRSVPAFEFRLVGDDR